MKYLVSVAVVVFLLSGCRDKIICPAFQSTYILDDSVRSVYYSYVWKLDKEERIKYLESRRTADTLNTTLAPAKKSDYYAYLEKYIVPPKEVEKTKYGIVRYEPYWMKNYQQRISPKENLLAPPPIPVEEGIPYQDVGTIAASDFADSTALSLDSGAVAVIEPDSVEEAFVLPTMARAVSKKEKPPVKYLYRYDPKDSLLNVEQEYYNKYFGQLLVDNRRSSAPKEMISEKLAEPQKLLETDSISAGTPGIRINFGKKEKKKAVEEILPDETESTEEEGDDGF